MDILTKYDDVGTHLLCRAYLAFLSRLPYVLWSACLNFFCQAPPGSAMPKSRCSTVVVAELGIMACSAD